MANFFFGSNGFAGSTPFVDSVFNFTNFSLADDVQITKTATQFKLELGGLSYTYTGSNLTYSGNFPAGGTLTNFVYLSNNQTGLDASGLNYPVAAGNGTDDLGRHNLLFSGNDVAQGRNNQSDENYFAMSTGNDSVAGGPGADTILGNQGDDVLLGNQDNDIVVGGQGNDIVVGGQGNDFVFGNEANDICFGNEGNDTVFGGQGDDTIYGGQGNDLIYGNQGNDIIYGNEGADRLVFAPNDGADKVFGFVQAEGDRLDLQGLNYTIVNGGNGAIISYTGGTIELMGINANQVNAGFFA